MMRRKLSGLAASRIAAIVILTVWAVPAPCAPPAGSEDAQVRPRLEATSEVPRCPGISGRFVAILDPDRGMLLLSGAPFPGGRRVGEVAAGGGPFGVTGLGSWHLSGVTSPAAPHGLWAVRWRFRGEPVSGCVGFDKDRFSAEGDLASYLHWLVGTVYARLPASEREASPALRLADRRVALRVTKEGRGSVRLEGKEGATLACRFADSERVYLAIPFVLDGLTERVAVQVGFTDRPYWESSEKTTVAIVVVLPGAPARLPDLALEIAVLDVAPSLGG